MTYAKPEISILGDAAHIIHLIGKCIPTIFETDYAAGDPAYDLDE